VENERRWQRHFTLVADDGFVLPFASVRGIVRTGNAFALDAGMLGGFDFSSGVNKRQVCNRPHRATASECLHGVNGCTVRGSGPEGKQE